MNAPVPFYPPVEPKVLKEVTQNVAERLMRVKAQIFDIFMKRVAGFWELPPRQQAAIYIAAEDRQAAIGSDMLTLLLAMSQVWAPEAAKHARRYAELQRDGTIDKARMKQAGFV